MPPRLAFLTAEWRYLAMLNFPVEPGLLQPYVPAGTLLDAWRGTTYVSLVGFLFRDTRVLGLSVPWHRTFEEINLRFYVRRETAQGVRRAVTFIKELVPRPAIAAVARLVYNEPYQSVPMRHRIDRDPGTHDAPRRVEYAWHSGGRWNRVAVTPTGAGGTARPGSEEEFITEHYWGYTRQRDGSTVEYEVEHPTWRVWPAATYSLDANVEASYGPVLGAVLRGVPTSVFLADGSPVTVYRPRRIGR